MRILLIGGTGLISTSMTRQLCDRGHEVVAFNRGVTARRTEPIRTVYGDRRNAREFIDRVRAEGPFDVIVDMICYRGEEAQSLVEAARGVAPHVILCSTVDVYRKTCDNEPINESAPQAGMTEYARNKRECEAVLTAASQAGDFSLSIGRPAYTYGEGGTILHMFGWGTEFIDRLLKGRPVIVTGDGTQMWTSTHVDDVAAGFVAMIGNPMAQGRAYNLTGDEWLSWNRYHEKVAEAIGAPPVRIVHIPADALDAAVPRRAATNRFNFQYSNIFDNEAAKRDLGFATRVAFSDGMRRTYQWLASKGRIANSGKDRGYDLILSAWEKATARFVLEAREADFNP